MARPEKPLSSDLDPTVRALALRLRELRDEAGLPYAQLGSLLHVTAATISRYMAGVRVPSAELITDFAKVLKLSPKQRTELLKLHKATLMAVHKPKAATERLRLAVQELHRAAGAPSVRDIAERSGIPRSTAHRVLTNEAPIAPTGAVIRALLDVASPQVRNTFVHRFSPAELSGQDATRHVRDLLRQLAEAASALDRRLADGEELTPGDLEKLRGDLEAVWAIARLGGFSPDVHPDRGFTEPYLAPFVPPELHGSVNPRSDDYADRGAQR